MSRPFNSLGLMSGTSGDGVDASIIRSDGKNFYEIVSNKYFEYSNDIVQDYHKLKKNINRPGDLKDFSFEIKTLEREITIFHSNVVLEMLREKNVEVDLLGFHGQTILHSPIDKFSKQLGDGKLLSQLTKKKVIYDFRQNDIANGGEGAPLAPIFHQLIIKQNKIDLPVCILNIGGISNVTIIKDYEEKNFISKDLGPGNCLIDEWVRKNKKSNFDKNGELASIGKTNILILNQAVENYDNILNQKILSFDTKDFDINFVRGLSLEDGAATLTDLTGRIIANRLFEMLFNFGIESCKVLVCGGGRKNKTLLKKIELNLSKNFIFQIIDNFKVEGDFVESQAFAFMAIRSYLNLPISFPSTTGCRKPSVGGILSKNY